MLQAIALLGVATVLLSALSVVVPFWPFRTRGNAALMLIASGIVTSAVLSVLPKPPRVKNFAAAKLVPDGYERPPEIWQARRNTVACRSIRSAEGFAFLDALGKSRGLRNPQSDASQTDCRHVRRGAPIRWHQTFRHEVLVQVSLRDESGLYMLSDDLEPRK